MGEVTDTGTKAPVVKLSDQRSKLANGMPYSIAMKGFDILSLYLPPALRCFRQKTLQGKFD